MPYPPIDQLSVSTYVRMHDEVVSQKASNLKDNVIIVSPNAQMANLFRITVFALIVGLLLDKAVHVHFSSGWHAQLDDILVPAVDIQAQSLDRKPTRWISTARAVATGTLPVQRTVGSVCVVTHT